MEMGNSEKKMTPEERTKQNQKIAIALFYGTLVVALLIKIAFYGK